MNSEILYKRLLEFARGCQKLTSKLPKTSSNLIYCNQLIRCSSSPGANYIEAIEASSPKDFVHKLKICKKEARESSHWLELIKSSNSRQNEVVVEVQRLLQESTELVKIFTSSIITSERNQKIKQMKK